MSARLNRLRLKRLHIDTQLEHIVFMLKDCSVYKSEGFSSMSRVLVKVNKKVLIASLNIIDNGILKHGEAGLSENAWLELGACEGDMISFMHPLPVDSMKLVRKKMYGKALSERDFRKILRDVIAGRYSNVELTAFITACSGDHLSLDEITSLTKAMVGSGRTLRWKNKIIVDKHCVGGLPGNRTTPVVVAIVAAAGLRIPKTSSRAITSPAGTADTMATLTEVNLDDRTMRKVMEKEGACLSWGGTIQLSPADDILIRIERALDIDSYGQMIASVLSKKKAAGSTHVLIDIPVGKTAKVRTREEAEKLKYYLTVVGTALRLKVKAVVTDGSQPVGRGIGPALEAMDVLSVLKNERNAPADLRERSLMLAACILEFAGNIAASEAGLLAEKLLTSGAAWKKFRAICLAQGGLKTPHPAKFKKDVRAPRNGTVKEIDNRKLAKIAKLAGAPQDPGAGVFLKVHTGTRVKKGDCLYTVYAEAFGELSYAFSYLRSQKNIVSLG